MGKWIVENPHRHEWPGDADDFEVGAVWECSCGMRSKVSWFKATTMKQWRWINRGW